MTPAAMDALKRYLLNAEDRRLNAYLDTKGILTAGIGHNLEADPDVTHQTVAGMKAMVRAEVPVTFSDETVDRWFAEDIQHAIADLDHYLPWWNDQDDARQVALCELCFSMGIGVPPGGRFIAKGLRSFSVTLKLIEKGGESNYDRAADNLLASKWARDVKTTRAERVAGIIRTGELP